MESEENGKDLIFPTPIPSRLYDSAYDSDAGFLLGRKHSYNSDHVANEIQPSLKPRIKEYTSFNPYFTAPHKPNKVSSDRTLKKIKFKSNLELTLSSHLNRVDKKSNKNIRLNKILKGNNEKET